ncbi:hypothetical protein ACQP1G_20415 [Nocardia sp. CA-107356]|uniref:hypothetical protein n=1 Tax=Nocardia sp. CA-107356 TaxID=3239972 RepID=UPI003D8FC662
MTPEKTTPTDSGQRTNVWTIGAATLLVAIMIAGSIAFAIKRTTNGHQPTISPPSATSAAPPMPPVSSTGEGFDVPETDLFGRRIDIPRNPDGALRAQTVPPKHAGDPDWLSAAPAGLREQGGWQRVHGAVVPFSTSDGPTRIHDGVADGYAHTPQGAALAAAMSLYQVAARPGDRAVSAARLVLSPADQATLDSGINSGRLPHQQPASLTRTLIAYDAFRIDTFADDLAVVRLAVRGEQSAQARSWVTAKIPMVWYQGDWRLRGNGNQLPTETVYDLTGWTQWS